MLSVYILLLKVTYNLKICHSQYEIVILCNCSINAFYHIYSAMLCAGCGSC